MLNNVLIMLNIMSNLGKVSLHPLQIYVYINVTKLKIMWSC